MSRQAPRFLIALLPLILLALPLPPATGFAGAEALDPGLRGPLAVSTDEYDFGDQAFTALGSSHPVELRAVVHHPADLTAGPFPLLMFMHGMDVPCHSGKQGFNAWPCPQGTELVPSYRGYDYLAEVLASN